MNGSADGVIFKGGQVEVSRTILKIGKKSFPIAGIASVEVLDGANKKESWQAALVMVIITIVLMITIGDSYWTAGAAVLAIGSVFASLFAKKAQLMLRTAGGDVQAMTGKQAEVEAVHRALEEAFSSR